MHGEIFWCMQRQSLSNRTVNWNFALHRSRKLFFFWLAFYVYNDETCPISPLGQFVKSLFPYKSIPTDVHESIMSYLHFMANLKNISHSNSTEKLRSIGLKEFFLCVCVRAATLSWETLFGTIFLSSLEGWVAIQRNDKGVTSPVVARSFMQI